MSLKLDEKKISNQLSSALIYSEAGKVSKSLGLIYEAYLPGAAVGSLCDIYPTGEMVAGDAVKAEVIGFRDKNILLMPFEEVIGVNNDSLVLLRQKGSSIRLSDALLGRVIDSSGRPIDGKGPIIGVGDQYEEKLLYQKPTDVLKRSLIDQPLDLGVRALNGMLTTGKGQRVGIMAGSGVGKSVLLGMMARNTAADVNVIALIGERGREVREFIERDLGPEGLRRSVVIVATSDASPLLRMRGAFVAATIAEYFRERRKDVLLMMDSLTRFAMAQREIGLSLGEPPATKGYTPSVFATLPRLLERAGTTVGKGSITGLYTVLVEGDDMDDPIGDAARSILDGHIVLSRALSHKNHFPAIDVLQSASRVMPAVIDQNHRNWAGLVKEWLATYGQVEDLVNLGAYVKGANPKVDLAVAMIDRINAFLRQDMNEKVNFAESAAQLHSLIRAAEALSTPPPPQVKKAPEKAGRYGI